MLYHLPFKSYGRSYKFFLDKQTGQKLHAPYLSMREQDPPNYRPIGLTSVTGNLMATIIGNEIIKHMETTIYSLKNSTTFKKA